MTDPTRIYLVHDDDHGLVELQSSEFDSEDILQRRLAEHPELLATTLGEEERWLLVTREHEVPDHDGGSGCSELSREAVFICVADLDVPDGPGVVSQGHQGLRCQSRSCGSTEVASASSQDPVWDTSTQGSV